LGDHLTPPTTHLTSIHWCQVGRLSRAVVSCLTPPPHPVLRQNQRGWGCLGSNERGRSVLPRAAYWGELLPS
jgi:hypothetical protein